MLNFNQFINESREDEFNSLKKGDILIRGGIRFKVTSVEKNKEGMVIAVKTVPVKNIDDSTRTRSISLSQFKQQVSGVIKNEKTEDDNED